MVVHGTYHLDIALCLSLAVFLIHAHLTDNLLCLQLLVGFITVLSTITENTTPLLAASGIDKFYHPTSFITLPENTQTLHFSLSSSYIYKMLPSFCIVCIPFKTFAVYCDHLLANKYFHISDLDIFIFHYFA